MFHTDSFVWKICDTYSALVTMWCKKPTATELCSKRGSLISSWRITWYM